MADKEVYPWSFEESLNTGTHEKWIASYQENCACAKAISKAIDDHYHNWRLHDCAKEVMESCGYDRVNWVLANTVNHLVHDSRITAQNKDWANTFRVPEEDMSRHFIVQNHPGLVNLFINQARKVWQECGLYDRSHCDPSIGDYSGQVLVLKPTILKDEFKTGHDQLFYATDGFGCSPTATGRKVYGQFLDTGERTFYNRSDFFGVIAETNLPEWAVQRVGEIRAEQELEDTVSMGGM